MSMTREEAIKYGENKLTILGALGYNDYYTPGECIGYYDEFSFVTAALSALRSLTREQAEKVRRGEWEWFDEIVGTPIDGYEREWGWRCSECKTALPDDFDNPDDSPAMRFCQWCGAPMTDEAVEILVKRMEGIKSV